MADPASLVYSSANPGLATVLTSGLGPLHELMRQEYARQKQAAAATKTKAAAEKLQAPPKFDMKGSEWFQPLTNARAQGLYPKALKRYQTEPLTEARFGNAADEAEHNGMTAQELAVGNEFTKAISEAEKNNLDKTRVAQGIERMRFDENGKMRDAHEIDLKELAGQHTNADYINAGATVEGFLKGISQKQETDYTTAARTGRAGMFRSSASNIFASDDQGKTIYTLDGRGNRVPKIANIQALEQAALQNPQMAALLRRNQENGQKPTASLLMGLGPEHVTDDQLEALNAQTDQQTPHARQALADLVRPYGTLVAKQRELSALAIPRPPAGSKPKFTVLPNTEGGAAGVGVANDQGHPVNYPSTYVGQAPQKQKPDGDIVPFARVGAVHNQFIRQIPGQADELITNNSEPQDMQYDKHFTALVTPSGKLMRPHNEASMSPEQLHAFWRTQRERDPRLTIETVINGSPVKGKNELGDRNGIADQLAAKYSDLSEMDLRRKPVPSRAELLKEADDLIAKQNATYQFVYRGGTKREIDNYAPGAYNGKEKAAEIEHARAAADAASKPGSGPKLTGPAAALHALQVPAAEPAVSDAHAGANRFRKPKSDPLGFGAEQASSSRKEPRTENGVKMTGGKNW